MMLSAWCDSGQMLYVKLGKFYGLIEIIKGNHYYQWTWKGMKCREY